jgi:hypothetical protein
MMIGPMGAPAPSAATSEMSVLRALARLLDPEAGPYFERIAESLPREDVKTAILGLRELLEWITALTPIEPVIAAAVEDLQHREAVLVEREANLIKREERAAAIGRAVANLEETAQ